MSVCLCVVRDETATAIECAKVEDNEKEEERLDGKRNVESTRDEGKEDSINNKLWNMKRRSENRGLRKEKGKERENDRGERKGKLLELLELLEKIENWRMEVGRLNKGEE